MPNTKDYLHTVFELAWSKSVEQGKGIGEEEVISFSQLQALNKDTSAMKDDVFKTKTIISTVIQRWTNNTSIVQNFPICILLKETRLDVNMVEVIAFCKKQKHPKFEDIYEVFENLNSNALITISNFRMNLINKYSID